MIHCRIHPFKQLGKYYSVYIHTPRLQQTPGNYNKISDVLIFTKNVNVSPHTIKGWESLLVILQDEVSLAFVYLKIPKEVQMSPNLITSFNINTISIQQRDYYNVQLRMTLLLFYKKIVPNFFLFQIVNSAIVLILLIIFLCPYSGTQQSTHQ